MNIEVNVVKGVDRALTEIEVVTQTLPRSFSHTDRFTINDTNVLIALLSKAVVEAQK